MPPSNSGVTVIIAGQDDLGPVLDKIEERLRRAAAAGQNAGNAISQGMGHTYTSTMAASGAMMTLEGRMPIRATERFLALLPGVSTALTAAFPVIGAISFISIIGEGVNKLVQFYRTAQQAGGVIAQAYRAMHESAAIANDDLRIQNDRLDNQIAKLEHKPENNLKLAIDEDRKSVDQLTQSLGEAVEKSDQLIEKNHVSRLAEVSGQESTDNVAGTVHYYRNAMADAGAAMSDASAKGDKAGESKAKQDLDNARAAYAKWIRDQIAARTGYEKISVGDGISQNIEYAKMHGGQDANLAILRGERTTLDDQTEHQQLQRGVDTKTATVARLQGDKEAGDAANKLQEAQEKLAAAKVQFQNAEDKRVADAAKAQEEFLLAANEDAHKRLLESDEQYYRDKAAITAEGIRAQRAALNAQEGNLQGQVTHLQGEHLSGTAGVERDAKVVELKTKIVELDGKSAELTAQQAKNTATLADELDALTKKRTADADAIAAKLEAERGGSTQARSQQSTDEYQQKRKSMVAEYGSDTAPAVQNLDAQQRVDQTQIGVQGADQTYGAADSGIQRQRQGVTDQLARGQITDQQAQEQRIALDREEAAALQPVLDAYKAAAAAGDLSAAEKVAHLQQQITELNNPVNQVAANIRGQLNSALEDLWDNLDKGAKAWENFGKALQKDVQKDTFKMFIEPMVQRGFGAIAPNGGSGAVTPGGPAMSRTAGGPSIASAVGGFFTKALGLPSTNPKVAGGGGVNVQIINQTSSPARGTATSSGSDDDQITEMIRPSVIKIMLQDLSNNGSIGQALSGGMSGGLSG